MYEIKKNGQMAKDFELFRKTDCTLVACIFAIRPNDSEVIPLKKVK